MAGIPALAGVTENRLLREPASPFTYTRPIHPAAPQGVESQIVAASRGVPINRAADLEEARRLHESHPAVIEIWAGTCGNYQISTNIISQASTNSINIIGTGANTLDHSNVWPYWNTQYTLGSTTASTIINSCGWPFNTLATGNTITEFTWGAWVNRYDRIKEAGDHVANIQRYSRRKLSETELLAALDYEKKMREESEKRALEAKLAEKRAEDLLRLCLSSEQIEDLDKKSCFYVEITSSKDNKKERYRIDRGSHGNVKQIDEKGSIIRSFCIQPSGVPVGDVLLTQKLWLEASEETREEFWATANITTLAREKDIPHTVPRKERRRYAEAHGLLH
jgi:hypothetical protein